MANVFVLSNPYVSIGGTDLSCYVRKATLDVTAAAIPTTSFCASGWSTTASGKRTATLKLEFNQSYTASELDAIIWPFMWASQTFEVRPSAAAASTNNPKWTGSVVLTEWVPFDGDSTGDGLVTVSVTWTVSGAVTRATT